uniref:CSON013229 protein n=1 Tax=Culicoides sonorensis TaxID=179676 RepID=A0A336KCY0_CULSO
MKQFLVLIAIIALIPNLISCDDLNNEKVSQGTERGLHSRNFFEKITANYHKIKSTKAVQNENEIVKEGMRLFIDMARGRKNNWLERIVPLFILPFLIQSAIVPFIVQTIKLLVIKSLLIGKTALLFFVLGLLKNSTAMKRSGVPYYLKEIPADERPDDAYFHHFAQQNIAAANEAVNGGASVGSTSEVESSAFPYGAQQRKTE